MEKLLGERGTSLKELFMNLHDGGAVAARPDVLIVLPYWNKTFQVYVRYGGSNGKYGDFQPPPRDLIANSMTSISSRLDGTSTSPFSSIPHLFHEVKVPLTFGNLYKHIDSSIGFSQEAYNVDASGEKSDNRYPMAGDYWMVDSTGSQSALLVAPQLGPA